MAKMKTDNTKCKQECEAIEFSFFSARVKNGTTTLENCLAVYHRIKPPSTI